MKPASIACSFTAALLLVSAGRALAYRPARLAAAEREVARGAYAEGPATLIHARAQLETMATAEPGSAILHYWVAFADWRLAPRLGSDRKNAERYCRDGLDHVAKALAIRPDDPEALALKASLQGLSLQFDSSNLMQIAGEMETGLRRAATLAPRIPRVKIFDGLNTLHKPAFVGGGAPQALAKFQKAIELFGAESASDSLAPTWGHEDAFIWAGRSALAAGDTAAARRYYAQALEVNPGNGWVRSALIPETRATAKAGADSSRSSRAADAGKP